MPGHIDSDLLEWYLLGRVRGAELDELEDHLLVCPRCQDTLEETQDLMQLIKEALARPVR